MSIAYIFPGQGSQKVGMGRQLADSLLTARHLFEEVDDALNQNLSRLMFEGPESELVLTENAQPALMAVSMAIVRVLEADGGVELKKYCSYVAGHSLGEYSALAAVGSLSLKQTAQLLKRRGLAMQRAVPIGEGAMAALLGVGLVEAQTIAADAAGGETCVVANDNSPQQVVLSGTSGAVTRAVELASNRGVKRAIMLPVSAPFHSPLMEPAASEMEEALKDIAIFSPEVPLIANVTAESVVQPEVIRQHLVEQVCSMVRWRESVLYLRDHDVNTLVELGSGNVLTGLTRRINRDLGAVSLQTPEEIEGFCKGL